MPEYMRPEEVDALLKLRSGQAARLARRGSLPATILPGGVIRFEIQELQAFLKVKPVTTPASKPDTTATLPPATKAGGARQ